MYKAQLSEPSAGRQSRDADRRHVRAQPVDAGGRPGPAAMSSPGTEGTLLDGVPCVVPDRGPPERQDLQGLADAGQRR